MKKLLLLLLFLVSPSLFAQNFLNVDPPQPKEGDEVELHVGGAWPTIEELMFSRMNVDFRTITIDMLSVPLQPVSVLAPWGERLKVGRLEDGTWTVIVRVNGDEIARHTFVVEPVAFRVSPRFGEGHTRVLIEGVALENCLDPSCVTVMFGQKPALAVEVTREGQIIATAPINNGNGPVNVSVRAGGGPTVSQVNAFNYGPIDVPTVMERVLFPLDFAGPGANGSQWQTDIVVRNDGPVEVPTEPLFWTDPGSPVLPIPMPIAPGGRGRFGTQQRDGGAFFWVARDLERFLSYSLHVVDRSRSQLDRGTEVPIVRAEDTASEIRILNVPTGGPFRAKLRLYNFDLVNGTAVTIEVRKQDGTTENRFATLNGVPVCPAPPCIADRPAFAVVDLPALSNDPVDLLIHGQTNDLRLWAFVSVTNNDTQHVTVYTPQHDTRGK